MSYGQAQMSQESTYKYASDERQMKKIKKPGFFKRWLLGSVKDAIELERQEKEALNMVSASAKSHRLNSTISLSPSIDQPERALQFTVYNANGGRIVETRKYDHRNDRNTTSLYVITGDMDFGKEIDKIITMEALKQ